MPVRLLDGILGFASLAAVSVLPSASPAQPVCSVFSKPPCMPTVCSVFRREPCIPHIYYPIGQDLRLTIESASAIVSPGEFDASGQPLATLRDLFSALRACWIPPGKDEAWAGMQMSVRFAFKRDGDIVASPRVTYSVPNAPRTARQTYRDAISAALARCLPLHFSDELGAAVAGRPIAVRFVDDREFP